MKSKEDTRLRLRYVVRNLSRQAPNNRSGGLVWGPRGECERPLRDLSEAFDRANDEQWTHGDAVEVEDTNGAVLLHLPPR